MTIKHKLYALGAIAMLGVIALLFTAEHFATKSQTINHAIKLVGDLEIRLLNLRRNEKDFLLRSDVKYLNKFDENITKFLAIEENLAPILNEFHLPSSQAIHNGILDYQQGFRHLVNAYQKYGLSENSGQKGQYQQALQATSASLNATQLLSLAKFNTLLASGTYQPELIASFAPTALVTEADALHQQHQVVGLAYNQGLLGETRALSHKVEQQFVQFSAALISASEQSTQQMSVYKNALVVTVIVLILAGITLISRTVNQRVEQLLHTIQDIVSSLDISKRAATYGNDEMSQVARYLNQLLTNIESLVTRSQQQSHQLAETAHLMESNLNSVLGKVQSQADHTTSMASAIKQSAATMSDISHHTNAATNVVKQTSHNANASQETVQITVNELTTLTSTLANCRDSVHSLNQSVDEVGGAVVMIQSIAEQTNLLALNAAIEAARAGEQGRGFAVVADEVRALATRTHQSTEEITQVVSSIRGQMSQVISDMTICDQQGAQAAEHTDALQISLNQIITDMTTIEENSIQIAKAIEEQDDVMHHFEHSIEQLNELSQDNQSRAKICLQEVIELAEQASELDRSVAKYQTSQGA